MHHSQPPMSAIVAERLSRRSLMKGVVAVSALAVSGVPIARAQAGSAFSFKELKAGSDERHHAAEGYDAQVLIRWGDPVLPGAAEFDPRAQTGEKQARQFGYNNDYICYVALPGAENPSAHGLLCVNHETVSAAATLGSLERNTREHVDVQMAAVGGSVVEVKREGGRWAVVRTASYNRRIHAGTPIDLAGPAAGNERLKTSSDPTGRRVLGMLGNCAGGLTPWRTWLSGEENVHNFFGNTVADTHREADNYKRFGSGRNVWGKWHDRFDLAKEPNELNRFGWIVEIDPLEPASIPKKRTALGRFKHEGAAAILNRDGRIVVYTGDDEKYEFVYRFVSAGRFDPKIRAANMTLLDDGVLSVARYNADGTCDWLPLVYGHGPLSEANGFRNQADVLIETRRAARLLGATPMDRTEDIDPNPITNKVYVALTANANRKTDAVDRANPRPENRFGHILEMMPPGGDHAAGRFGWDILLLCGDPAQPYIGATFHPATSADGWFGRPDNLAVDGMGRLWVATDGNKPDTTGRGDGLWAIDTDGPMRRLSRHFYRVPAGAECTGPFFTPDDESLFVSVQHPGGLWPDFRDGFPPRPSVVVITKTGGGKIAAR
ncbi:MAG: PhoX family protein [Hyphomicrobiaceae bacterium]